LWGESPEYFTEKCVETCANQNNPNIIYSPQQIFIEKKRARLSAVKNWARTQTPEINRPAEKESSYTECLYLLSAENRTDEIMTDRRCAKNRSVSCSYICPLLPWDTHN